MRHSPLLSLVFRALAVGGIGQKPFLTSGKDRVFDSSAVEKDSFLIFNEVNSLLRQWGNSLAPNGFSITLASVPANTLLYHARTEPNAPSSPEWFAFDAEMSYGIYGGRKNTSVYLRTYQTTASLGPLLYFNGLSGALMDSTLDTQELLAPPPTRPRDVFEDYARAKDLCLWASKRGIKGFVRTNAGFELILCNTRDRRLKLVRNLDVTTWADDMNDHSDRSGSDEDGENRHRQPELANAGSSTSPSSTSVATIATSPPFPQPPGQPRRGPPCRGRLNLFARYASWEWLRATSHVYNGLGETRVKLDSGWHVTSRGIGLDSTGATRVAQLSPSSIQLWKEEVDDMVRLAVQDRSKNSGVDWRALTDLMVNRYGDRLPELAVLLKLAYSNGSPHTSPSSANATHLLHAYRLVSSIVLPFYDHQASREERIDTCAPDLSAKSGEADPLNKFEHKIWTAIMHVHRSICVVILDVHSGLANLRSSQPGPVPKTLRVLVTRVDELIVQLDWPSWVRCPEVCPWGQVCFIPIWPLFGFGSGPNWPGRRRPEPQCVGSLADPA